MITLARLSLLASLALAACSSAPDPSPVASAQEPVTTDRATAPAPDATRSCLATNDACLASCGETRLCVLDCTIIYDRCLNVCAQVETTCESRCGNRDLTCLVACTVGYQICARE